MTHGANVIPLYRHAYCAACGVAFRPLRATHTVCARCFRWHRIGIHLAASRRLLGRST